MIRPILLLLLSNIFMTFAWYGHLKNLSTKPLWVAILASWGIAFFEYCFQVPGNRYGSTYFTLPQLKMLQEIITLVVFVAAYLGRCYLFFAATRKIYWDIRQLQTRPYCN